MERPRKSKRDLKPRRMPIQCVVCGSVGQYELSDAIEIVVPMDGDKTLEIDVTAYQCKNCGNVHTTEKQTEEILDEIKNLKHL